MNTLNESPSDVVETVVENTLGVTVTTVVEENTLDVAKTLEVSTLEELFNLNDFYVVKTLEERLATKSSSVFDWATSIENISNKLKQATWVGDTTLELLPGTTGYRTEVSGISGVVKISDLDKNTAITLDDKETTGKFIPTVTGVDRTPVNHTVLVIGPSDEETHKMVIWAVHPGNPINKSILPDGSDLTHGSQITVEKALELGMQWANIV